MLACPFVDRPAPLDGVGDVVHDVLGQARLAGALDPLHQGDERRIENAECSAINATVSSVTKFACSMERTPACRQRRTPSSVYACTMT